MAKNTTIDKIIELLEQLKKGESTNRGKEHKYLKHGMISIEAIIDRDEQRITILPNPTSTSLKDRKATTIEGLAHCMLDAVKISKGK